MAYKKILLAVDFASDNDLIIEKAMEAVQHHDAELLLVHVNEPLTGAYVSAPMGSWNQQVADLEVQLRENAERHMKELAARLKVAEGRCFLRNGKASAEIKRLAEEQHADLIVLGTHGQHGLQLLLGSTANAVLHGVSCDVLAIRAPG